MNHEALKHILRAVHSITGDDEFIIVGSQAVLGTISNPTKELLLSQEVDIIAKNVPYDYDKINGALGEFSDFHRTYYYYADGINLENIRLPINWKTRLILKNICLDDDEYTQCKVFFLSLEDMIAAKLYANRPKDQNFVRELKRTQQIDSRLLMQCFDEMELEYETFQALIDRYDSL